MSQQLLEELEELDLFESLRPHLVNEGVLPRPRPNSSVEPIRLDALKVRNQAYRPLYPAIVNMSLAGRYARGRTAEAQRVVVDRTPAAYGHKNGRPIFHPRKNGSRENNDLLASV